MCGQQKLPELLAPLFSDLQKGGQMGLIQREKNLGRLLGMREVGLLRSCHGGGGGSGGTVGTLPRSPPSHMYLRKGQGAASGHPGCTFTLAV